MAQTSKRIPLNELSKTYEKCYQLSRAGLPFQEIFRHLAPQANYSSTQELKTQLQKSQSIPAIDLALIHAGEKSGTMDSAFLELAQFYKYQHQTIKKMFSALNYPVITLILGIGLSGFTNSLSLAQTCQQYLPIILVIVIIFFLLRTRVLSAPINQSSSISIPLPFLQGMISTFQKKIFYSLLKAFTEAGFGLRDSLLFYLHNYPHTALGQSLKRNKKNFDNISSVSSLFAHISNLKADASMIEVGEKSGTLSRSFQVLEEQYAEEFKEKMETLAQWLPKMIYAIVVLILAYQIISGHMARLEELNKMLNL